ncbi:MAG: hypothetical protein AB7H66_01735 [Hyphomonadaceae bacterium]
MVMLVHVTAAKLEPTIKRSGLRTRYGIYAFPVLPNFTLTHQWGREIMKWKRQPMIGVYFRIPDDEVVRFGRYGRVMRTLSAARAVGEIRKEVDARGFQIIIDRAVTADEIARIAPLRGVTGWRHKPDAHGRRPCGCPGCIARGEPGARKIRARYEEEERRAEAEYRTRTTEE